MFLLYPIATDRRPKEFPFVTYGIAAVNVLVTAWWLLFTGGDSDVLRTLAFVPGHPTWYGVFTSMFMHGGVLHLLSNMLFLVLFGRNVEDALGRLLFACSYLVCGVTAMIMHLAVTAAFRPDMLDVPTVGASGAISGLLGLFAVRFYRTRITIWYFVFILLYIRVGTFQVSSLAGIGVWFALQFLSGMLGLTAVGSDSVAYWAHIGGFVFGVGYALLVGMEAEGTTEYGLGDAEQSARLDRWESALRHASTVLQQDPHNAAAHLIAGQSMAAAGKSAEALDHFREALTSLLRQGEPTRIVDAYRTIQRAAPDAPLPARQLFNVAAALVHTGNVAEAETLYEHLARTARTVDDRDAALLHLGTVCLRHTGNLDKAAAAYKALLRAHPDSDLAPHAREGLRQLAAKRQTGPV